MSTDKKTHDINEDIKNAKEWCKAKHLPPGHTPGKGSGWRNTCYRLAQYVELQNELIHHQLGLRKTIMDELKDITQIMKPKRQSDEEIRAELGSFKETDCANQIKNYVKIPGTPEPKVSKEDLRNVYMRGFRDAMESKTVSTCDGECWDVKNAYNKGHHDGWIARKEISNKADEFIAEYYHQPIRNQS